MSIEDRLRNALRMADEVEPEDDGWLRIRRRAADRQQLRRKQHIAVLILVIGAVSLGSLGAMKWLAGGDDGVVISQPPIATQQASSPSPVQSPTEPSVTPSSTQPAMHTYVSSDGTWEVKYPAGWSVDASGAEDEWRLFHKNPAQPAAETELRDGEYLIEFRIQVNTQDQSLNDLQARYCEVPPGIEATVTECKKVEIDNRTWAWALMHETTFGGVSNYAVGTVVNGKIYEAFAHVPDGQSAKDGLAEVREIISTFKVNS